LFRALWFFAQLAIVACAIIWIATQKGTVDLVWNDYSFSLTIGLFLLIVVLFTLAVVVFFRLVGAVINIPNVFSRRRGEKNRKKGFEALTRGFVALAAGDSKRASALARDVKNLLPEQTALPLLLEAQAARLRGDDIAARQSFEKLLDDKDAAFLGIRGLVKSSLESGDTAAALTYARTAQEKNPKQPWILKSVYDLEIQTRAWEDAYRTLQKLLKHDVIEKSKGIDDQVALLMILAAQDKERGDESGWKSKLEKALKLDPAFVPAVYAMGDYYLQKGKTAKVQSLVERAWRDSAHPSLAILWDKIAPMPKASDPLRRLRWFEKLAAMNEKSADGQIEAAKAAMENGLYGQAREYLDRALSLRPTVQVYKLLATLEDQSSHDAKAVRGWMEKAYDAVPDSVWYCNQTGHIYEEWRGVSEPEGLFNTIEWGQPAFRAEGSPSVITQSWGDPLLIGEEA
jgi:HemY protein